MNKLEKEIFEMEQELGVPSDLRWHNIKPKPKLNLIDEVGHWNFPKPITYNEEEVIELLQKALTHKDDGETGSLITAQGEIRPANFFSWFERFKKK